MDIADTVTFSNGVRMPRLGLGTYKTADGEEVVRAVRVALETGVRSIDTASLYGNEAGVGQGVRESGVPREEVFVTTKVWNDDQGYDATRKALERSLEVLGFEYVDLYLIHWPVTEKMCETWRAMEDALDEGLVRSIGVSNFLPHHIEEVASVARTMPMVDQVEFHPRLQQPEVIAYCREHDIVVEAWRPIMRGAVTGIDEIARIATAHGKSPAQVSIRWILQKGMVVIPKSARPERIREDFDVFDFELSEEEMAVMDSLDRGERLGPHPDGFSF